MWLLVTPGHSLLYLELGLPVGDDDTAVEMMTRQWVEMTPGSGSRHNSALALQPLSVRLFTAHEKKKITQEISFIVYCFQMFLKMY